MVSEANRELSISEYHAWNICDALFADHVVKLNWTRGQLVKRGYSASAALRRGQFVVVRSSNRVVGRRQKVPPDLGCIARPLRTQWLSVRPIDLRYLAPVKPWEGERIAANSSPPSVKICIRKKTPSAVKKQGASGCKKCGSGHTISRLMRMDFGGLPQGIFFTVHTTLGIFFPFSPTSSSSYSFFKTQLQPTIYTWSTKLAAHNCNTNAVWTIQ